MKKCFYEELTYKQALARYPALKSVLLPELFGDDDNYIVRIHDGIVEIGYRSDPNWIISMA